MAECLDKASIIPSREPPLLCWPVAGWLFVELRKMMSMKGWVALVVEQKEFGFLDFLRRESSNYSSYK
jgi:hypothetical protein